MHGLCERVGVGMESSSPPPYIVVEGVRRGLKFSPLNMHPPNKETCSHQTWRKHVPLSMVFPHGAPPSSQHSPPFVEAAPHHGGPPQHLLSSHKGLPPQGEAPQNSPHLTWDLVPSRWDKMFSATVTSEKFRKVPEHFRHPLKLSGRAPEHFQYGGLI